MADHRHTLPQAHRARRLRPSPHAGPAAQDPRPRQHHAHQRRGRAQRGRHGDDDARNLRTARLGTLSGQPATSTSPTRWTRTRASAATTCKPAQRLRRRLPDHPDEDRLARAARHSAGRQGIRPHARRPGPRHRPHRLRQVHHAGGADRLHQHRTSPATSSPSRSRSSSCTGTRKASSPSARCPIQTPSFADGLRAALREDADIVLVGEMRDLETISLALTAAETGLLVFGTLHTNNARKTVRPYHRRVPRRPAVAGAHHARRLAARRRRPVAREEGRRQGPRRGERNHRRHPRRRRHHPRGCHAEALRRDHRRQGAGHAVHGRRHLGEAPRRLRQPRSRPT